MRSGGNVQVHTADAVAFVESTTERYDLILMDAFLRPSSGTDATGVPTGFKTLAFLGHLKRALAPGGVVAFNVNEHASMADDIAAVAAAFGQAAVYRCPPADNKVVIAAEGTLPTDDEMRARAAAIDTRFGGGAVACRGSAEPGIGPGAGAPVGLTTFVESALTRLVGSLPRAARGFTSRQQRGRLPALAYKRKGRRVALAAFCVSGERAG